LRLTHKYLIIGSDGLWDFIDISKVHKNIKQEGDAENIAKFLTKTAIENGSNDNITVIVLKLN
jgi:serine/threonine protein phosphatase PrpC